MPARARCAAQAAPPGSITHLPVVYSLRRASGRIPAKRRHRAAAACQGSLVWVPRLRRAAALPVCCHGAHKIKKSSLVYSETIFSSVIAVHCAVDALLRSIRWHRRRSSSTFQAPRHLRRGNAHIPVGHVVIGVRRGADADTQPGSFPCEMENDVLSPLCLPRTAGGAHTKPPRYERDLIGNNENTLRRGS